MATLPPNARTQLNVRDRIDGLNVHQPAAAVNGRQHRLREMRAPKRAGAVLRFRGFPIAIRTPIMDSRNDLQKIGSVQRLYLWIPARCALECDTAPCPLYYRCLRPLPGPSLCRCQLKLGPSLTCSITEPEATVLPWPPGLFARRLPPRGRQVEALCLSPRAITSPVPSSWPVI